MTYDYIRREKQRLAARNERITYATLYGLAVLVFGFAFTVFGWAAATLPANEPVITPFPEWTLTALLSTVALLCFVKAGYFTFAFLDECFLPKHDTRRVTGKRK